MENISFVIWILFWPLTSSIGNYLNFLMNKKERSQNAKDFSIWVEFMIWVAIGGLLYNS